MLKYFILVFLLSCMPQGGNVSLGPGSQGAIGHGPEIDTISVVGAQLIINGRNFTGITYVTLKDPTSGTAKPFAVKIANLTQLISDSIDTMSVPVNKTLELILANAYGQTTYPVTFTLQPNAVATANIQDNAVTAVKIPNKGIPVAKFNPSPYTPNHGDVLAWDATPPGKFIFIPFSGGGGGGGGISSIIRGEGIASPGTNITAPGGTIAVDRGETGDPLDFKIPYFNNNNKIVLDSSSSTSGKITGLNFMDGASIFDIYNDSGFLDIVDPANVGTPLFSLDNSGKLKLAGSTVCTQATGCSGAPGSSVTKVTATAPLGFTGTSVVDINAGLVNTPNNLVKLDATGAIPATVKGVVNSITAGPAISVTPASTGAVTVGVVFGAGNAQRHQTYLDTLGTLSPNDNYMIIGNGSSTNWEVQGGDALLTSIGAQKTNSNLTNLGTLLPLSGNIIVGTGALWNTSTIPNCASGNFNFSNGTSFSCSDSTSPISAGTITTFNQVALQIKEPSPGTPTGEIHFFGSNDSNYVGLRAAGATIANTVWTLPAADGISGDVLSTNGSGKLSWVNLGSGNNVSGIAPSTDMAIARWSGITGKIIQNSGVIISDNNQITNVSSIQVRGNTTTPEHGYISIQENSPGGGPDAGNLYFEGPGRNNGWNIKNNRTNNRLEYYFMPGFGAWTHRVSFDGTNNRVGIGVLAPTTTLDVGGTANISGNTTVGGTLGITGNTTIGGTLGITGVTTFNVGALSSTFPTDRGTTGYALTTNAAGALSWSSVGGASDVSGPGSSTVGNLASFNDTNGKVIKDSGIKSADVVTNLAASSLNAVATFYDTSGKIIQNSLVSIDSSGNVSGVANFTSTGSLSNTGTLTNSGNVTFDTDTLFVNSAGNRVGMGTNSPNSSSILDLTSTTMGLLLPRMTTAQRNAIVSPVDGLMIYNSTTKSFDGYSNSAWKPVVSPSLNTQTGTTYSLAGTDCGSTVTLNNGAAIAVSMPNLLDGCRIDLIQLGVGVVTVSGTGGMILQNSFNLFRTRAQYSVITVTQLTSILSIVSGDVN